MREIKFRFWNGTKMEEVGDISFMADGTYLINGEWPFPNKHNPNQALLEFTCLKDKNGKDIYEGDIVIWNDGGGETELNPKKGWIRKAIVKLEPSLNFELTEDTPSGEPFHKFHYGNFIYKDTRNHLKVIGNIYENPELAVT